MIFTLERVSEPAIEPVTLTEMKRWLRMYTSSTSEDDDITSLIVAGREWVEDFTARALIDQSWRLTIDQVSPAESTSSTTIDTTVLGMEIMLHRSPALAITSFVSVDSAGDETTVDAADYALREADSKWPRIVSLTGTAWTASKYKITYRAGFADRLGSPIEGAEVVPARFKQAIKTWVEANYDRDEKMMNLLLDSAKRMIKSESANLGLA